MDTSDGVFAASQDGDVPPYIVPVLRLVSSTHVEPTTGLVLSESGLVLVPGGFASAGDEIVVLDGGTDIVGNGRTARIARDLPMVGLQVLDVYGLRRSPAPFADSGMSDGDPVRLRAFPPAEQIVEGAAPLDVAATVTVFGENAEPAVSGDNSLPNVTGPLLDACGNVAAFSVANDIQTMASSPGTRYRWRTTLLDAMERLGVTPAPSACIDRSAVPEADEATATDAPEEVEAEPAPEPSTPPVEPEAEATPEEPGAEMDDAAGATPEADEVFDLEILPPIETDPSPEPPPMSETTRDDTGRYWGWLILAGALIAAGLALHFWRRRLATAAHAEQGEAMQTPVSPASGEASEFDTAPADSQLRLEGRFADGRPLSISCPVNRDAINLVIGRGHVDLRIASAAISRRHAALNGTADTLTLTDLGSSNGTMLNGVPCMEGEIFYVEAGDTLVLGDARFTLELAPIGETGGR
ncbi:MAG: FHA domain-containing protein [Gammaproteobacteria bacterium]|nr:FHA domain-containing protein [Gammaproteobacteria bacterium]